MYHETAKINKDMKNIEKVNLSKEKPPKRDEAFESIKENSSSCEFHRVDSERCQVYMSVCTKLIFLFNDKPNKRPFLILSITKLFALLHKSTKINSAKMTIMNWGQIFQGYFNLSKTNLQKQLMLLRIMLGN